MTIMKPHRTCPQSGALIFDEEEGTSALKLVKQLADLVLILATKVNEGNTIPETLLEQLRELRSKA